jgi:hypothetical protein
VVAGGVLGVGPVVVQVEGEEEVEGGEVGVAVCAGERVLPGCGRLG